MVSIPVGVHITIAVWCCLLPLCWCWVVVEANIGGGAESRAWAFGVACWPSLPSAHTDSPSVQCFGDYTGTVGGGWVARSDFRAYSFGVFAGPLLLCRQLRIGCNLHTDMNSYTRCLLHLPCKFGQGERYLTRTKTIPLLEPESTSIPCTCLYKLWCGLRCSVCLVEATKSVATHVSMVVGVCLSRRRGFVGAPVQLRDSMWGFRAPRSYCALYSHRSISQIWATPRIYCGSSIIDPVCTYWLTESLILDPDYHYHFTPSLLRSNYCWVASTHQHIRLQRHHRQSSVNTLLGFRRWTCRRTGITLHACEFSRWSPLPGFHRPSLRPSELRVHHPIPPTLQHIPTTSSHYIQDKHSYRDENSLIVVDL